MGFVKLSVSDHCSSPPSSVSIHLYQDFPMSYRKCLQNIDILREEIERFVDGTTQREFQTWVRDRYAEEMVERCTRHIKGGWHIDGCSLIYLHWLCQYPPEVYYEHHHGLPQADFHAVVTRVMHLSDGWATPTSHQPLQRKERVKSSISPRNSQSSPPAHSLPTELNTRGQEEAYMVKLMPSTGKVSRHVAPLGGSWYPSPQHHPVDTDMNCQPLRIAHHPHRFRSHSYQAPL